MAKELYQQGLLQQQPLTSLGEEGSVSCTLISLHLSQVNTYPRFRFVPTVTSLGDTLSHPPWLTRVELLWLWGACPKAALPCWSLPGPPLPAGQVSPSLGRLYDLRVARA